MTDSATPLYAVCTLCLKLSTMDMPGEALGRDEEYTGKTRVRRAARHERRRCALSELRTKGAPVNDATARGNQSAARARASGARESREARRRCCAPNVVRVTRHSRSDRIEFRARVSAERAAVYFSRRSRQPARLCRHPAPLEVERVRKRRRAIVSVTRRFHRCHLKAPHPPKNIARRGRSNRRFLSRSGRRGTGFEPPVVGAIAAPPLDILRRRSRLFSRRASLHGATGDCLDARLRVSRVARTSLEPRPHPPLLRSSVEARDKTQKSCGCAFRGKKMSSLRRPGAARQRCRRRSPRRQRWVLVIFARVARCYHRAFSRPRPAPSTRSPPLVVHAVQVFDVSVLPTSLPSPARRRVRPQGACAPPRGGPHPRGGDRPGRRQLHHRLPHRVSAVPPSLPLR